jgi:glycosyltransferase involved in cell wall biosynthesis
MVGVIKGLKKEGILNRLNRIKRIKRLKNILMVVEKRNSAIGRLAEGIKKYNSHFNVEIIDVHPKRPSPEQIDEYRRLVEWADLIDYEYWKTASMLLKLYPNSKPKILSHYNPYNIMEENWSEYDAVTVANKSMEKELKNSVYIPLAIDLDFFQFNREYTDSKTVLMVSSRIEGKKGVLQTAQACKELGYKMLLVGRISKMDYFNEVMATGVVEFRENTSEEELLKAYYESAIFVGNSIDDYESGTLPQLEAMACGVPVITRNVGHTPELFDETNMIVRKGGQEDVEDLKNELRSLIDDKEKRLGMRENAWKTVKTRDNERRARMFETLWYETFYPKNDLVSVIIPTFNRKDVLERVIEGILDQDWPAVELIIVDDGSNDGTLDFLERIQKDIPISLKILKTDTPNEYNLAYARNLGVVESVGEILVFSDDRYFLHKDFISTIISKLKEKTWVYGNKNNRNSNRKNFVENISCIYRQELIDAGMFNSTVKLYGFQTQELNNRFRRQNFKFILSEESKVDILLGTKSKYTKKDQIRRSKNKLWKLKLER